MADIHVGDVGTDFQITVLDSQTNLPKDISSSSQRQIVFGLPDGTSLTKTATFVNTGTDGLIRYVGHSGDLSQAGTWKIQGIIFYSSGAELHTDVAKFKVKPNIAD